MKLNKKITLLALVTMFVGTISVSSMNYTGYYKGPDAYSGQWKSSDVYSLNTSTYASVRGDRTHLEVIELGWLRKGVCVEDNNRHISINMYEDDVAPNEDEYVKYYRGDFEGLNLVDVYRCDIKTSGNIDSATDNTVELYIDMYLFPSNGDKSSTNGELFYFRFGVE